MRLPRVRLRTLLILVALVGIGVGGLVLWRRSVEFRRRADEAERFRQQYVGYASTYRGLAGQYKILRELQERQGSLQERFREQLARVEETLPGATAALDEEMRRNPEMARLARENHLLERVISTNLSVPGAPQPPIEDEMRREAVQAERIAAHYDDMRAKYDRAARYPFFPVDPDLPMPE